MTLNTNIYILDRVDPHEVFNFCNRLLGADYDVYRSEKVRTPENRIEYYESESEWIPPGAVELGNRVGQGLPALFQSIYRENAPLHTDDYFEYDDFTDDPDGEIYTYFVSPACYMSLSFDTPYGYRNDIGGASTLHGLYIVELYHWLKEQGVNIKWQNEMTGVISEGLSGLGEFFNKGDDAEDWFHKDVAPHLPRFTFDK